MIQEHAINTAWYGDRVGVVTNPEFFSLDTASQATELAPYAWVEFSAPSDSAPQVFSLLRAGFAAVDVQVNFRIALGRVASTPSLEPLDVCFADANPFSVRPVDVMAFEHERFQHLPDMTESKLNMRYVNWAEQWIAEYPEWCLQVVHQNKPQGWFLSQPTDRGLNLTLSMLHRDATISGMHLYQRALIAYAQQGARIGWASFSINNTPVHNIYATLGARFLPPTTNWLWVRRG